ncbi:hypothetical protein ACTIVE_1601 [Actinomadura verrucosospora]|uniref:Uncharacterized protein n=1 Tax=Actinomadura verrucosospora TaxID=46165 RepID=A0A7D4A147_ACTVE|nr:hypothetical protein ACTIVE_1601 [Actinomadura verrucosospora]
MRGRPPQSKLGLRNTADLASAAVLYGLGTPENPPARSLEMSSAQIKRHVDSR